MKSMKFLLTFLSLFLLVGVASAQKAGKMTKKVANKVAKLDRRLTAIDKSLALTADQKEKVTEVYKDGMTQLKAISKGAEDRKAQRKAINKAMNKKVQKEILTKAQRNALKKARKASKKGKKAKRVKSE